MVVCGCVRLKKVIGWNYVGSNTIWTSTIFYWTIYHCKYVLIFFFFSFEKQVCVDFLLVTMVTKCDTHCRKMEKLIKITMITIILIKNKNSRRLVGGTVSVMGLVGFHQQTCKQNVRKNQCWIMKWILFFQSD